MQSLQIYQIDAFASKTFLGNPAAVIPLEEWLDDELMLQIAAENNLSETAFILNKNGEGWHIRWFTPAIEVNLCGHATLAAAHALSEHLGAKESRFIFRSKSGLLEVEKTNGGYILNFPADDPVPAVDPGGIIKSGLGHSFVECYKGREDFMVVMNHQEEVASLNPDFVKLKSLESRGLIVTAPGFDVDFVSRSFFPATGIDEDPVTGSAHTTLTPYWKRKLGKEKLKARQISLRGGELTCWQNKDRVYMEGQAVTYLSGRIFI